MTISNSSLPSDPKAPKGLCGLDPGDLLARGIETGPSARVSREARWVAPEPEELAKLLPQYQIESLLGSGGIRLTVSGTLQRDGSVTANGVGNSPWGVGNGAGGSLWVSAASLSGSGAFHADGGGGNDGGGGGRIAVYCWNTMGVPLANITANSGQGGNAQNGTLNFSSTPYFEWMNLPTSWHGAVSISGAGSWLAVSPANTMAYMTVSRLGNTVFAQNVVASTGAISWDTSTVPNGVYCLTVIFRDVKGQAVGTLSQNELVNNAVAWHGGIIATSGTWAAGAVHVIESNVTIPNGVTLTVQPGAIVKFSNGTGITVQTGGILNALATSGSAIVLTSLADDSVGGDTNMDGKNSLPVPGNWRGIPGLCHGVGRRPGKACGGGIGGRLQEPHRHFARRRGRRVPSPGSALSSLSHNQMARAKGAKHAKKKTESWFNLAWRSSRPWRESLFSV